MQAGFGESVSIWSTYWVTFLSQKVRKDFMHFHFICIGRLGLWVAMKKQTNKCPFLTPYAATCRMRLWAPQPTSYFSAVLSSWQLKSWEQRPQGCDTVEERLGDHSVRLVFCLVLICLTIKAPASPHLPWLWAVRYNLISQGISMPPFHLGWASQLSIVW